MKKNQRRKSLKQMRTEAGLTQAELAANLKIDQATVSRYEMDERSVPVGVYDEWEEICGHYQQPPEPAINPQDPYNLYDQQLALLRQFLADAPDGGEDSPEVTTLLHQAAPQIKRLGERPLVALLGRFDAGKSHLINHLLGKSVAAVRYQPATAVPVIFRHLSQRPEWMKEEVWILDKAFDPDQWQEEENCAEHRVAKGGLDLLNTVTYGGHNDAAGLIALAFIDAPILKACTLIDSPGFNHKERESSDAHSINFVVQRADAVIYLSPLVSCFDAQDQFHLPDILGRLGIHDNPQAVLSRFTFLVTHAADHVDDAEVERALNSVAERLFNHLKAILSDGEGVANLSVGDLRQIIRPFWSENPQRSQPFIDRLSSQVTSTLVALKWASASSLIERLKSEGSGKLSDKIIKYEAILADLQKAADYIKSLREAEPARKATREQARRHILNEIFRLNNDSVQNATYVYEHEMDIDRVERRIRKNYKKAKDAQEGIGALLTQRMQRKVSNDLKERGETLTVTINEFLAQYEFKVSDQFPEMDTKGFEIPFDSKGAFAAGLGGGATFGLLALWASTAGNLGGYILIANLVGILSGLGIATGSSATIMAGVAALGGPITIAIAMAVAIGAIAYMLFGHSWEHRLAKKVVKAFREQHAHLSLQAWVQSVWDDTRKGFDRGADYVESAYLEELAREEATVNSKSREEIEQVIQSFKTWRDFFNGMPGFSQPAVPQR